MTNPLLVESYKAFGATPTPLPWGEVYGALQTGIIQGQENPGFFLESTKMYEVTDVITCIGHNNFTTAVMANKDFYDGLAEEDQQVVAERDRRGLRLHPRLPAGPAGRESSRRSRRPSPTWRSTSCPRRSASPSWRRPPQVEEAFIEMTGDSGKEILDQMKEDLEAADKRPPN